MTLIKRRNGCPEFWSKTPSPNSERAMLKKSERFLRTPITAVRLPHIQEIIRISRFVFRTRVWVEKELKHWRQVAGQAPDLGLRQQAWRSLSLKSFHALGGNIFATRYPEWESVLIPLIVALQTISDYLDNLCDRMQLETRTRPPSGSYEAFLDA